MKQMCNQVIDELLGKKVVDFDKIDAHTADAKYRCYRCPCVLIFMQNAAFSVSDVKAAVSALRFVICNAVKYDVEEQVHAAGQQ